MRHRPPKARFARKATWKPRYSRAIRARSGPLNSFSKLLNPKGILDNHEVSNPSQARPMAQSDAAAAIKQRPFLFTYRKDTWWLQPVLTFIGLGAFIVYSTWAAFQNAHYYF